MKIAKSNITGELNFIMLYPKEDGIKKGEGRSADKNPSVNDDALIVNSFHVIPVIENLQPLTRRVRVIFYAEFLFCTPSPRLFQQIGQQVIQLLTLHAEKVNITEEGLNLPIIPEEDFHGQ